MWSKMCVRGLKDGVRDFCLGLVRRFFLRVLPKLCLHLLWVSTLCLYLCVKDWNDAWTYWWDNESGGGIHWLAWDRMSMAKGVGGLGFKQLHNFNLALLGKQGWLLLTNPTTLVARIFQARYYPKSSFMEATVEHNLAIVGEVSMMLNSSPKQEPVGDLVMGIPRVFGVNLGYWIRRTLLFQQKCLCHFIKH